eukprot:scaffold126942_cov54-Phaeocystis_antarctica.AAC.2
MFCMVVTLEVSKLRGWLNTFASCRVERRACDTGRRGVRAGRREGLGQWRRKRHVRTGSDCEGWGPGHVRSARKT